MRFDDGEDLLLRTGLVPQKYECADEQKQEEHSERDFQNFFHIIVFSSCLFFTYGIDGLDAEGPVGGQDSGQQTAENQDTGGAECKAKRDLRVDLQTTSFRGGR